MTTSHKNKGRTPRISWTTIASHPGSKARITQELKAWKLIGRFSVHIKDVVNRINAKTLTVHQASRLGGLHEDSIMEWLKMVA